MVGVRTRGAHQQSTPRGGQGGRDGERRAEGRLTTACDVGFQEEIVNKACLQTVGNFLCRELRVGQMSLCSQVLLQSLARRARVFLSVCPTLRGGGGLSEFLGGWISNPTPPHRVGHCGGFWVRRRWSRHFACGNAFCLW